MKDFVVYVKFPQLPAAHCDYLEREKAGNFRVAVNRVLDKLQQHPRVKGRRHKEVKITVREMQAA